MLSWAAYLRIFFTLVLGGTALVGAVNFAIDPKALWHPVEGGTLERPLAQNDGGRLYRSERLARGNLQAVILGSSRCAGSIDPKEPAFAGMNTFNACMLRSNIAETIDFGRFAAAHNRGLRRLVIALDFFSFTSRRASYGDYEFSRLAGNSSLGVASSYLLSFDTLELSLSTLIENLKGRPVRLKDNGFNDVDVAPPKIPPRKRFDDILLEDYLVSPVSYAAYHYDPERTRALDDFLSELRARHIDVWLYIPPIHARQMEVIRQLGLQPVFERWLTDVTRVAADNDYALYDFATYNPITNEVVPPAGDRREMKWYWESSHAKANTGRLVVERLWKKADARIPAWFGVRLTPQNIATTITQLDAGRAAYARLQPGEVAEIERLVRQTEPVRARLRRLYPDSQAR